MIFAEYAYADIAPVGPFAASEPSTLGRFALGCNFSADGRGRHDAEHEIGKVGEKLRAMVPWIGASRLVDKEKN